jgi:hypothetical protein
MRRSVWWCALAALPLWMCACGVVGGGGSGVDSPFFDDAASRKSGTVDGYLAAPMATSSQGKAALVLLPYPPDLLQYRPVDRTQVVLGTGQTVVTDARGLYLFRSVRAGEHTITASDPTGGYAPAQGKVVVEEGAITSGTAAPIPSPEAPAVGYFAVGTEDFLRLRSAIDTREWRRLAVPAEDTNGAYRFGFAVPGADTPDEYVDLEFSAGGVRLRGGPWGTLDPYGSLLAPGIRVSDRFDLWSTLTGTDSSQRAAHTVATVAGVDDLVLTAGRFDNCARFAWSLQADGVAEDWTMWLAWRVGPVKLTHGGIDYQLQYGTIGGKEYR